jgi:hypothetical protein
LKTRTDYELAVRVVRDLVHEWDPHGLLAGGAPRDEFDMEIAQLVSQVPRIRTVGDAISSVSMVFSAAFEPELFTPGHCAEVGQKLYDALTKSGLWFCRSLRSNEGQ